MVIVVFDGVKLLDVAGPAEVFAEANRFGARYRPRIAGIESADTVLVAGGDNLTAHAIDPALVDAVREVPPRTRSRRSAWNRMRSSYATGTSTRRQVSRRGVDLALALVEQDHGAELVRSVARSLVVYLKRAGGQSQFSALVEADPPQESALRAVTAAIAADPGADHSVKRLAAVAALSTRQLTRLFHTELGTTPARCVEKVRIDTARGALGAGHSVADAAQIAGFGSAETLRRVFVTQLGLSPKAYRDRFRTAQVSPDQLS